jgi:GNAT superfamily N-acetyltransferase
VKIRFAVEGAATVLTDAEAIFPTQFEELSLDRPRIAHIAPDRDRYLDLENRGMLHCVTVRADGRMVGYYISAIATHLHYADAGRMSHTDLYYLLPEFRRGGIGAQMLIFDENTVKERGVVKIYRSTKAHLDNRPLLQALGHRLSDYVLTKYVGK